MKYRSLLVLLLLATLSATVRGSIVYSGVQNVAIPLTFDGIYLRLDTGATSTTLPADFSTAPWINPIFGGVGIGNSALLRPLITGADQILNLAPGTVIGAGGNFVAGASGSSTHVGAGAGQFLIGTPGYLGLTFRTSVGGPDFFGWIRLELNNAGPGKIIAWAYENVAGASIQAGVTAASVPEPGTAFSGLAMVLLALGRRARSRS